VKEKEGNLTLRQRFELSRQSTSVKSQPKPQEDTFLRPMVGHPVIVKFQNGEELGAIFTAFDRFTIKLGHDLVVFKHSLQSVRLACPENPGQLCVGGK
jgi:sRNA-binding regulator protein Hfq